MEEVSKLIGAYTGESMETLRATGMLPPEVDERIRDIRQALKPHLEKNRKLRKELAEANNKIKGLEELLEHNEQDRARMYAKLREHKIREW